MEKRYRGAWYGLRPRTFWQRFAVFVIASGVVGILERVSGFYAWLTTP
jgi:hypothetical protein